MNTEVHPAVAALVLAMTVMAVVLWTWGTGVAAAYGGPGELRTGPQGHHYIQIQNYLVEHDEAGEFVATHDLEKLGTEVVLGGLGFFSNGDLLVRLGPDPRSFFDNFRAYRRETNLNSIEPDDPDSGLFRCDLETQQCDRFGDGIDFKAASGVYIDWQTDAVYISDTTRHLLRKYSSFGEALVEPVEGFKFPNQLMLHDNEILVADTNHHVILRLESETSTFATEIDRVNVVPADATNAQQTWPSHFARVGDEWWVNNMQTGMNNGGIYVFDADWHYLRRIELPGNADPIAILPVANEVWVSDWNNDVVRRFSADGEPLPDLESSGLESVLAESRQGRVIYTIVGYSGVVLVVVVLLVLVVRALSSGPGESGARGDGNEVTPGSHDLEGPLLLEPDPKVQRRMNSALAVVVILSLLAIVPLIVLFRMFEATDALFKLVIPILSMFAIIGLIAWVTRSNWGTSIEIDGDTLTLRDYSGRQSRSPVSKVRYDDTAIATRDVVVILGRPKGQVYERTAIEEQLFPRLASARRVGPVEMLKIQVVLRHPQGIVTVLSVIGLIIYGLVLIAP